jgi:GDP-D-mannose 3',5'-epimerase
MKYLVTGGAGFIGSHLSNRLADEGNQVVVIDNLERGNVEFLNESITFYNRNIQDYDSIKDLFDGIDCVIHLASKVGGIGTYTKFPFDVMSSNILIDSNVLRACQENNINRYFYASSAHIYPKSLQQSIDSPKIKESDAYPADCELSYGWAKLIGEKTLEYYCHENPDFRCAIARFIGIYGPNQDFELETGSVIPVFSHRAIKYPEVDFVIKSNGNETRSYCYIDDAVDCILLMINQMEKDQIVGPLNVGKEERISIEEIANMIVQISEKSIDIQKLKNSKTLIPGQWCECKMAKDILGWEAKIEMKDGLRKVYNNIKERIK